MEKTSPKKEGKREQGTPEKVETEEERAYRLELERIQRELDDLPRKIEEAIRSVKIRIS